MTNTLQQRISKIRWGAASATLALAVMLVPAVITTQVAQAQTFTTLVNFDGTNGANPMSMSLVQGTDGNLYGTTFDGGATSTSSGTVFKISTGGKLTTLYSFCAQANCADGAEPIGGLVQGADGNFYGTTSGGGIPNNPLCVTSCGTVFKITPQGMLTTLYSFCSQENCADGSYPMAGLVQATDGNFYGTTESGGASSNCPLNVGCGTAFKITPAGRLTTIYSFCAQTNCTDSGSPFAGLVQASNGDLYGTTVGGGTTTYGTIFRITTGGTLTTVYSFCAQPNCTDGSRPSSGLVQAAGGNFYGTTYGGGANSTFCTGEGDGCGTVFKITAAGLLTTLYSFCPQTGCPDGNGPLAGLVQATDGNFYGTTPLGGLASCLGGCGTLFKISPGGTLTTLHSFDSTDGAMPLGGLVQATDGIFYGPTWGGGSSEYGYGTLFSIATGLGRFVETQPTSGKVGAAVKILGTKLTGATSVTFNGTAAKFTVVSKSEIKTTVPEGATTGKVEVTIPKRTLKSNAVFRVKK